MFERYNEKARRTIFFARYEASQFGQPYIQSEHLLLGLLREGKTGLNAILGLNDVDGIRALIEASTTPHEKVSTSVDLPLSEECKRILNYAAEEATRLESKHIGLGHLLLAILREEDCFAAKILQRHDLKLEKARPLVAGTREDFASAAPAPSAQPAAEEIPATRKPPRLRVVVKCGSELLLAYRARFGPPRIGESILLRGDDGATAVYRIVDIEWELSLSEPTVLKEVTVRVSKEEPA